MKLEKDVFWRTFLRLFVVRDFFSGFLTKE